MLPVYVVRKNHQTNLHHIIKSRNLNDFEMEEEVNNKNHLHYLIRCLVAVPAFVSWLQIQEYVIRPQIPGV